MSANLGYKPDFIKVIGDELTEITPEVKLSEQGKYYCLFENGFNFDKEYIKSLGNIYKVVIAIFSNVSDAEYKDIGITLTTENYNEIKKEPVGIIKLRYRDSGINFANKICNIMLLEAEPKLVSLIEEYQYTDLRIDTSYIPTIYNRIFQLFGRVVRGENDFGIFLIKGKLFKALKRSTRIKYLSPALQIAIKEADEEPCKTIGEVTKKIHEIFKNHNEKSETGTFHSYNEYLEKAARFEASAAEHLWGGHESISDCKEKIEKSMEALNNTKESKLKSWYRLLLSSLETDSCVIQDHYININNSFKNIKLKTLEMLSNNKLLEKKLKEIISNNKIEYYFDNLNNEEYFQPQPGADNSNKSENGVEILGDILGFASYFPRKEGGPDVIRRNEEKKTTLILELKINKKKNSKISDNDIGQANVNIKKTKERYRENETIVFIFIAP